MSGDSMRDQLETAFAAAEEDETDEQESGGSQEDTEESVGAEGSVGSESDEGGTGEDEGEGGEEGAPEGEDEGEPAGDGETKAAGDGTEEQVSDDASATGDAGDAAGDKAPVSWKPGVREHWNSLPKEVKAEVTRREREIQTGLQQASGHKKVAEEYFRTVQPFQQLIQAQGSTPAQAIHKLMTTAAQLTSGTPQRKAEVVRNIIKEYGVDVPMLDTILSGEAPPDDPNAGLLTAMDEKLKPITDFMGRVTDQQEQNTQQTNADADKAIQEFADANEFYDDLREDMADLMELAAKRGRQMTLEQAYQRAAAADPEISKIMKQREDAARNVVDPKKAGKKRAAASSIKGSPTGQKSTAAEGSMRAQLEEAWDDGQGEVGHG